jgi:hypothetical protein
MLPQLYKPTTAEITHVTASARRRHPDMAQRIDKAAEILLNGDLTIQDLAWEGRSVVQWRIASQTHKGAYIICGLGCPCQDSRAAKLGNVRFCKHAIAVASYLKILRNRLNADIRSRVLDLGILPDGTFNAWAKNMGIVSVVKDGSTYRFLNHTSAVHYSLWLAKREAAQAIPVTWPQRVAVAA